MKIIKPTLVTLAVVLGSRELRAESHACRGLNRFFGLGWGSGYHVGSNPCLGACHSGPAPAVDGLVYPPANLAYPPTMEPLAAKSPVVWQPQTAPAIVLPGSPPAIVSPTAQSAVRSFGPTQAVPVGPSQVAMPRASYPLPIQQRHPQAALQPIVGYPAAGTPTGHW